MSLILFRTSQISFIRDNFHQHNSAFDEENDSRKKILKEVVCLIFVFVVRISFDISGELGKVSLSSVSVVLVAFIICGRPGKV